MGVSVTAPVGVAFERMKTILFRPFDFTKWLTLGFCAFLAYLGEGGGGSGGGNWGRGGPGSGGGPSGRDIADWVESNLALILLVGGAVVVVVLALTGLLMWLSSRGKFMLIDGVVRNRGAVVEPWREFRALGNSLAAVRFAISAVGLGLVLGLLIVGSLIAWPDLRANEFGGLAAGGIAVAAVGVLCSALVLGVVGVLIEDFTAPAMYRFGLRFGEAWQLVLAEVVGGRVGTIVLYFLMKIGLGICVGLVAAAATCATCCVAALPYVGTVILLPLYVFLRCYSLSFLEQLGPGWAFFAWDAAPAGGSASAGGVWYERPGEAGPEGGAGEAGGPGEGPDGGPGAGPGGSA